jgi:hypothetical protein
MTLTLKEMTPKQLVQRYRCYQSYSSWIMGITQQYKDALLAEVKAELVKKISIAREMPIKMADAFVTRELNK